MSQAVKIPVVERKRPLIARIFNFAFWGIFLTFILLFIFTDDSNNQLGKIFIGVLIIFVIGVLFIKNPYEIVGDLILEDTALIFVNNHTTKEVFSINKITDIHLQYQGYQGRGRLFTLTFDSGLGNIISFKYLGTKYKYELFLEKKHVDLLKKGIENLRKKSENEVVLSLNE